MSKLVIGNPISTNIIQNQYVLKIIFSAENHQDYSDMWFFDKANEVQLLEAIKLIREYLAIDHNTRCGPEHMFTLIGREDIPVRIADLFYEDFSDLDKLLEDLAECWPVDSNYNPMMLDTFYITFYNEKGNPFEVTVED